jgi:hypothetical protein
LMQFQKVFPQTISNKKTNRLCYEEN